MLQWVDAAAPLKKDAPVSALPRQNGTARLDHRDNDCDQRGDTDGHGDDTRNAQMVRAYRWPCV